MPPSLLRAVAEIKRKRGPAVFFFFFFFFLAGTTHVTHLASLPKMMRPEFPLLFIDE